MTGSAGQVSSLKDCWPIETPSGLARDYLQYLMLQYLMLNLSFVFWINLLLIHGLRQLPQMRPRVLHPSPTNASSHQYMKFSILWGRHATDSCSYRKYVYIYIYIYILFCIHKPCNAHFLTALAWDYPQFSHCYNSAQRASIESSSDNSTVLDSNSNSCRHPTSSNCHSNRYLHGRTQKSLLSSQASPMHSILGTASMVK